MTETTFVPKKYFIENKIAQLAKLLKRGFANPRDLEDALPHLDDFVIKTRYIREISKPFMNVDVRAIKALLQEQIKKYTKQLEKEE